MAQNFELVKMNEFDLDPSFTGARLGISCDPSTGKPYRVTIQQWLDLLASNSISYKGPADISTDPGTPDTPESYSVTEEGTYTNFLDAEGEAITLDDGEFAYLSFNLDHWVKQPVAIALNTYLQKESIKSIPFGKNLFNKATIISDKYIDNTGSFTTSVGKSVSALIEVEEGETYTLSGLGADFTPLKYYRFLDEDETLISYSNTNASTKTVTMPSGTVYFQFTCKNDADTDADIAATQLEKGDTATTFEAYMERATSINGAEIPYADISNFYTKTETYTKEETDELIPVVEYDSIPGSKNLFDISKGTDGQFMEHTGILITSAAYGYSDYIPVTPGLTYFGENGSFASGGMRKTCYFDADKVRVAGGDTNTSHSFVVPDGVAFVVISYFVLYKDTTQLEQGDEATPFVPYIAPQKILTSVDGAVLPEQGGSGSSDGVLTFENSDKILFTGCSYDESVYTLSHKNWINKLSNYTDWICANSGVSGYRIIDIADRLRQDLATYNLQPSTFKPTYITIANNGNEFLPGNGENLDLYMQQVRIAVEVINQFGAKPILGTSHHANSNVWLESMLKAYADENKYLYMGIGRNGEKITSHTYEGFWGGSHPGVRINSFVWQEWLWYISQLPRPRKAIKIFRARDTDDTVTELNYDTIDQRAERFYEINCGEKALNSADGSESYYDRLDEGTTVDPEDENNIIHNYTSQTNNNEYVNLLSGNNISFTNKALIELIIDRVNVNKIIAKIKADSGVTFYAKSNNDFDSYVLATRDKALVFQVTKAVYDAFTDSVGTKFTSSNVTDGDVQFEYTGKLKSYAMGKGWFLCFNALSNVAQGDRVSAAGTLVRVSDSANIAFTAQKNAFRYDYTFFNSLNKPQGAFVELSDEVYYDVDEGEYTITLEDSKYFQFDKIKLLLVKTGSFNVSDVSATYTGGVEKPAYTKEIKQKDFGEELITTRGFDADWLSTGGWTNESNSLVQMPSDVRDYPPYLTNTYHVELGFDTDGFPQKIYRDIALDVSGTDRRGWQKVLIRVVARLFPNIYNEDETGDYFTDTALITQSSYDLGVLCLSLAAASTQPELILRKPVDIGWSEITFETTLPIFNGAIRLSLWRDGEVSAENLTNPLQVYDVSCQIV